MMKKEKVMSQMKGQDKTPEKQRNEMIIGNLPEKEFRVMTVKMIRDFRENNGVKDWEDARNIYQRPTRTEEETNRDEEYTRRNQQQNNWDRRTDKWPRGRIVEITATDQNIKKKRMKRNEDSLRDLWDNIKHTNIHII